MFLQSRFADLTLLSKEGKRLPAHSNILAFQSLFFENIINPGLQLPSCRSNFFFHFIAFQPPSFFADFQWAEQATGEVHLREWSADALTEGLRFLYRGHVELSSLELTQELWTLAGHLVLPELEASVQTILLESLSIDTCIPLLQFATKVNNGQLREHIMEWVKRLPVRTREKGEEMVQLTENLGQLDRTFDPAPLLKSVCDQLLASTVPETSLTLHVCLHHASLTPLFFHFEASWGEE